MREPSGKTASSARAGARQSQNRERQRYGKAGESRTTGLLLLIIPSLLAAGARSDREAARNPT